MRKELLVVVTHTTVYQTSFVESKKIFAGLAIISCIWLSFASASTCGKRGDHRWFVCSFPLPCRFLMNVNKKSSEHKE